MGDATDIFPAIREGSRDGWRDRELARLAGCQHGVLARGQLLAAGLSSSAIGRRVDAGRLHPVHPGVYAAGHPTLTVEGRWLAAVLVAGPGAVLSHRSAAALWAIARSDRLEVTVERKIHSRRPLTIHQTQLRPDEITEHEAIPVTTVARTILDLAAVLPKDRLAKAMHEAEVLRLFDARPLHHLLERHHGRPGTANLRALLENRNAGAHLTRSELEDRFSSFVARHDLPPPLRNHRISGYECDAVWPKHRLIVELDGHHTHHTARAFEQDRLRDRRLQTAGWRVVRVTWRQMNRGLASDLSRLLAAPPPPPAVRPPASAAPRSSAR